MREIKFRAWNGVEMSEPFDLNKGDPDTFPLGLPLMQYTGLEDKNGKEIYENMILDDDWEVVYKAPKYILQNISNNDIIDIYENKHTITKEYSKL